MLNWTFCKHFKNSCVEVHETFRGFNEKEQNPGKCIIFRRIIFLQISQMAQEKMRFAGRNFCMTLSLTQFSLFYANLDVFLKRFINFARSDFWGSQINSPQNILHIFRKNAKSFKIYACNIYAIR